MDQDLSYTLRQMAGGYILSRCIHIVAFLGVADVLGDNPLTAAEIASLLHIHPEALNRIMHLLSAHGVFQTVGDKFMQSPLSQLLRSDHPNSIRMNICNLGLPINWAVYQELGYSIQTNHSATEKVYPDGYWDYLAKNPTEGNIFNLAMEGKSRGYIAGVIASYDFSPFNLIGDIGGGHGHLLRAILERYPRTHGVLFELPQVIEDVQDLASERLSLESGNFFYDRLPLCDLYLLMEILHDWDDEHCLAILRAIRQAMGPHSKLLVIERLIPDIPGPEWTKVLDVHMLALFGGKQRSSSEYEELFIQAGLQLECSIDTFADVSILEAVPDGGDHKVEQNKEIFVTTPSIS